LRASRNHPQRHVGKKPNTQPKTSSSTWEKLIFSL
jgi:hypothetical protein